jgi:hypothetical protein
MVRRLRVHKKLGALFPAALALASRRELFVAPEVVRTFLR